MRFPHKNARQIADNAAPSEARLLSLRTRVSRLPFRWKLSLISATAVLATLLLILVFVYDRSGDQVAEMEGRRLAAIAASVSAVIAMDSLAVNGARKTRSFSATRTLLASVARANDLAQSSSLYGVFVARASGAGVRIIVHSAWQPTSPQYARPWSLPAALRDSLDAHSGDAHSVFAIDGAGTITALSPLRHAADGTVESWVGARAPGPASAATVHSAAANVFSRVWWIAALITVTAFLVSLWTSGRLTAGIEAVAIHADTVARGQLRHGLTFTSGDEVGRLANAFRTMTHGLRDLLRDVETGASEVAATAEQLAAGAEQMSVATHEVSTAAQFIASSASHQTAGIHTIVNIATRVADRAVEVTDHAQRARGASDVVSESARRVALAANEALESMATIASVTNGAVPAVAELGEKSRRIGAITDAIATIARQTNLLALNASIEAARAGEHGRGFAVVAAEVRKLAGESGAALDTIRKLAIEIRAASERTGERIDGVSASVTAGQAVIRSSTAALSQITREIEGSRTHVARIVESAVAQQDEAASLAREIESIAEGAEQNAATSAQVSGIVKEQTASMVHITESSRHLALIASRLDAAMSRFQL